MTDRDPEEATLWTTTSGPGAVTGPPPGSARTVLGPVLAGQLGVTLPHEHLLSTLEVYLEEPRSAADARLLDEPLGPANLAAVRAEPYRNRHNLLFDDEDLAARELGLFRDAGGGTVVELTLPDIGRDLAGLARLARRTGLHVVAGCGYYLEETHSPAVAESTVEELAVRLVAELTADAATGGIPCGVLGEIGLTSPMTAAERKVLRAVAIAQHRTGAPVSIHTQAPGAQGIAALDVLAECGVDPVRVAISHVDSDIDLAYQTAIAERGAYVEYDFFGWGEVATPDDLVASDRQRVAGVAPLLEAGYGAQVLLSQDVVTRIQLVAYGGGGYAHLVRDLPPLFAELGVDGPTLRGLMVDNPARWLAWT
jgi:phosphotriesterase-related protein